MLTGFIGRNLIFLPKVDSTNSYATQLLKNVKPREGTVVYSGAQTQGRGQRSRVWNAEPGLNITMSVILFPTFLELKNQGFLYKIAALACYDTIAAILDESQFDIKIKWPNDILVNSRKVTGILIENNLIENKILSAVLGIGINVNQKKFEEQLRATSMSLCAGRDFETNQVMKEVCRSLEKYYKLLKSGHTEDLQNLYHKLLFGLHEWREFIFKGKNAMLKVLGTGPSGLLLLEEMDGNTIEADVLELRWIF